MATFAENSVVDLGSYSQRRGRPPERFSSIPSVASLVRLVESLGRFVWSNLPRGESLPDDVWLPRHRWILVLLWLHAVGVACYGVIAGRELVPSLLEGAVVAVAAALTGLLHWSHRCRAILATLGLLCSSAILVHLSGGFIEMHVDFFVLIVIVTLYGDWVPFLLALGYVVGEHIAILALDPTVVADYPDPLSHPWPWVALHSAFVVAATVAGVVHWRLDELAHLDEVERKRVEDQRARLDAERAAHARAREALHVRDELLSVVSHDLKDPLGTIKGQAQLLRRRLPAESSPEATRLADGLTKIDVTVTKVAEVLDELLDVAALQASGGPELQRGHTDLVALVRRVAARSQTTTDHAIVVRARVPALVGRWDAARLERAIANLYLHAMVHLPAGGVIAVDVARRDRGTVPLAVVVVQGRASVAARPTQPGLDRLRHVASVAGPIGGADIGVAVARHIVEQHGGTLDVIDVGPLTCRATVRLPIAEWH